jgi:hypothetical protein
MHSRVLRTLLLCLPIWAHAQGTFVYDQQSSTEAVPGEAALGIQANQPIGQSFTPSLSGVGFVRIELYDINLNGVGATLRVDLHSGSISGPVMASTQPVSLPDGFGQGVVGGSFADFIFSSPAVVAPGTTYYLQPIVESGDVWAIGLTLPSDYPGGNAFIQGQPSINDLWFREGIIVPEPSNIALALSGLACFAVLIRRRRNR